MKKTVSLLLLAALLVSLCCAACPASAEAAGPRMEDLEDQAFSLSLACWLSEFYCGQPESLVLWDALGWHAARAWRIDGQKLVSWKEASDFLRSLGGGEDMMLPEGWEEYDVVRTVIGAGSSLNYDFASHKDMFEAMIGVDTEVSMKLKNENTVQVCITRHGEGEPQRSVYHILFTPNPDAGSAYPYQLVWIQQMPAAPEMDGQLNFTWEELLDANMLSNVLSFSPAIRTSNPFYGPDSTTWIYRLNGHTAIVQSVNQYLSGSYGVWSFDSYDLPDGGVRACVGYYSDDPNEDLYDEYYLINYLSGITNIELLREEEELFWLDCTFYGESTEQIAIDKGTLVLREIDFVYDPAYEPSVTLFESSPAPELPLMEGWNGPLRSVTAHWEDYDRDYGCLRYRTETLELPLDWEYLPYDARWGDYTAYNTEAYVGTYVYPGDGIDYEVYFTVAKG